MAGVDTVLRFRAFSEPKCGQTMEEFEDACAANAKSGRFAIADGATESSYAALWARLLVEGFVNAPAAKTECWNAWLPALQTQWEAEVGKRPLSWFAEIKWQQGAFATFLGLVIEPPRWRALAVGDSCLFHIRDQRLLSAFPLTRSCDFACSPWLIGSRGFTTEMMAMREMRLEGEFAHGDRLWLMTDALAQCVLRMAEVGEKPWESLEPFLTPSEPPLSFKSWIGSLRRATKLRNDDLTLMAIW
jgi:Protein phosphatase 2C